VELYLRPVELAAERAASAPGRIASMAFDACGPRGATRTLSLRFTLIFYGSGLPPPREAPAG